jgi:small subunit ribosomal protein S1
MAKYKFIDPDEQGRDPFASEEQDTSEFESLLAQDKEFPVGRKLKTGETVSGTVLSVGSEFVFLDLGGKNAGSIACDEFVAGGVSLPKVGEKLTAYVRVDNGSEILLTRSLKRSDADDMMIRNAYENKIPVEAKIEKVNKGGFEALIGTKKAFVPMSAMDLVRIENPDIYIGGVFQFLITEMKGRNLVLSRKSLLREEQELKANKMLELVQEGQIHKATITRIMDFGAFASIEGLEGLISLNQLSAKRVKSASEVVNVGDVVSVRILKIEKAPKLRVSLSLKDGTDDSQWKDYQEKKVTKSVPSASKPTPDTSIFASAFGKAKNRG